jgi:hypothetical protein
MGALGAEALQAIRDEVAAAPEWSPETVERLRLIIHGSSVPVVFPQEAA